jgi:hypothetical protein
MCHFITLIAPQADAAAVKSMAERHGRAAEPIDNPSIRKVLREGDRQYVTARGNCDCGTVLGAKHQEPEALEDKLEKHSARLRRKGWSEAKIARAIDDRRRAEERPRPERGHTDSIELWTSLLTDLRDELKLPYAGLLVHFYSGAIDTEEFKAIRREVDKGTAWPDALALMAEDEVTLFRLK